MARRGRPKGGDSTETRLRILDAARREFATHGFNGASIATIASKAGLAPSAVYHYFGGKAALYEEVYDVTAEAIWLDMKQVATARDTVIESVELMVNSADAYERTKPGYSNFLALVPMEISLHPEFAHMLDRRSKRQDETFGALAELGLATGELDGFDRDTATEMLRALMMGWFLESHFRGRSHDRSGEALVTTIRLLSERQS